MEHFKETKIEEIEKPFPTFYDTTTPKILAIGLSTFSIIFVTPILFSIIWFEKNLSELLNARLFFFHLEPI